MDNDKLIKGIKPLKENPDEYIKLLEESFGFKLFYYKKIYLKFLLKFKNLNKRR